ncbi:MAG: flagellar brake protein [Betaproteobacteria bacterium]|nr:flagellar brake protein [Betaproteobacteria bacterium]
MPHNLRSVESGYLQLSKQKESGWSDHRGRPVLQAADPQLSETEARPSGQHRQPVSGETAPAGDSTTISTESDYRDSYEIADHAEVLAILRSICRSGALITFVFNHGCDFLLTVILAVSTDGRSMVIDCGGDLEKNRRALLSDRIYCEARLEKVKVQFMLRGVTPAQYEGRDAFLGAIPDSLWRLQRRRYYRLQTLIVDPVNVRIPLKQEDGSVTDLQAEAIDISGGGIGLTIPPGRPHLEKDAQLSGVTIMLPKVGSVTADMRVRNTHDQTMPNGRIHQRAVCQFLNLPGPVMNLIQRYIFQVQRERIARRQWRSFEGVHRFSRFGR